MSKFPDQTVEQINNWIEEAFPEEPVLLADGFEKALVGVGRSFSDPLVAVYDRAKCLTILQERDGMTEEEASEFFEFNVIGAYVGEQTPMFIQLFDPEQDGHPVH